MKINVSNIGGEVVKEDERYVVTDNKELKNLVLSKTVLQPGRSTNGHKHPGQEEVYIFTNGTGKMELDDEKIFVCKDDIVLVKDGVFHKVHNTGNDNLTFICVFDGKRNH